MLYLTILPAPSPVTCSSWTHEENILASVLSNDSKVNYIPRSLMHNGYIVHVVWGKLRSADVSKKEQIMWIWLGCDYSTPLSFIPVKPSFPSLRKWLP